MTDLLEALMILCFGISWPISIRKSWISRTAKGKSVSFELFIWVGYVFGIVRKAMIYTASQGSLDFIFYLGWFFYIFNILAITVDILLFFRNSMLDKKAEKAAAALSE